MEGFDFNSFFIPLAWVLAAITLASGSFLVLRSFLRFRYQVNQSIAMDIELVRVVKPAALPEGQKTQEAW